MRPLFDAEEMRAVDRWAIEQQGIPEAELMEAAGTALAEEVARVAPQGPVRILCGKGNNGGDGLVAARRLTEMGFEVEALEIFADELPTDLDAWIAGAGVVVDAIFGTGFEGAPREPAIAPIEAANRSGAPVVACDIASGVDASTGEVEGVAIEASVTVAFHGAKIGHRVAPGKRCTGELVVSAIGIPPGAPVEPGAAEIDFAVLSRAARRGAASTKFSSGQVAIAGGSRGLTGAVRMSSLAAIRAGAGYATVAVPADLELVFEIAQAEVMSVGCPGGDGCLAPASSKAVSKVFAGAAAGVFGPGLGRDPGSLELARELVPAIEAPLVLDADGLNAFAGRIEELATRGAPTVLTPHTGELGRLLERESGEIAEHRVRSARAAADAAAAVVVLKGDDTIVTDGERLAVNVISAPALATAGTGDVLSGMIAAMLARGLDPFDAACAAVLAHARAGRDAADRVGAPESVIAGDVIDSIAVGMLPATAVE
jgi:ADP-dependent NAD(P)H-hydrate dehydratase / NAD(P)H-hydrate epimerase